MTARGGNGEGVIGNEVIGEGVVGEEGIMLG